MFLLRGFRRLSLPGLLVLAACGSGGVASRSAPADLVLRGGKVWTADPARPLAQAAAVRDGRIVAVGDNADVLALVGPRTRVVELAGRFVAPGFNDAHTHIENAADWFFQVRVIDVNDQPTLLRRLKQTAAQTPPGLWITGGDLADQAWTAAAQKPPLLQPSLAEVDAVTPDNPLLLRRIDRSYFANSRALAIAQIRVDSLDPRGGRFGRDASGALDGMLYGAAGESIERMIAPPSLEQKLIGARGAIARLNQVGITSVHDIARLPALTDRTIPPAFVERSFSDLRIFQALKDRGQLTLRVYAFMPLDNFEGLAPFGITPNAGDELLRYGALKVFADSGIMLPPPPPPSLMPGGWSYRFMGEEKIARRIADGDKAGFDIGVHIVGDKAVRQLIDWYAQAAASNGPRDRRHRLIHAWVVANEDVARAGRMKLIADVTPDQLLHAAPTLDRALGAARSGTAFPWRRMIDAGVRVNLVSDLPGAYNKSVVAEYAPLVNMYVAVTRKSPEPGAAPFHPEQSITVEEALRAYTVNPAFSSREEHLKGSIEVGKLADLVVLTHDILTGDPRALLDAKVALTILGGKPVYEAQ